MFIFNGIRRLKNTILVYLLLGTIRLLEQKLGFANSFLLIR